MDAESTTATPVLKSDAVRMTGLRPIGTPGSPPAAGPAGGQVAVRIVQQNQEGAMLEVACACGQTILLHCTFDTNKENQV